MDEPREDDGKGEKIPTSIRLPDLLPPKDQTLDKSLQVLKRDFNDDPRTVRLRLTLELFYSNLEEKCKNFTKAMVGIAADPFQIGETRADASNRYKAIAKKGVMIAELTARIDMLANWFLTGEVGLQDIDYNNQRLVKSDKITDSEGEFYFMFRPTDQEKDNIYFHVTNDATILERAVFAMNMMILANGRLDCLLKDKPQLVAQAIELGISLLDLIVSENLYVEGGVSIQLERELAGRQTNFSDKMSGGGIKVIEEIPKDYRYNYGNKTIDVVCLTKPITRNLGSAIL